MRGFFLFFHHINFNGHFPHNINDSYNFVSVLMINDNILSLFGQFFKMQLDKVIRRS